MKQRLRSDEGARGANSIRDGRKADAAYRHCGARSTVRSARRGANAVGTHISQGGFDMKKVICAMRAAFGIRGAGNSIGWRWVHYHNI
ncbi:hypothetical protein [Lysobacter silvisoli]|uniref:hypothetical protein n=1 Tax=Lysobacter silvisoli TaxID=2293254 RepID=UPI0011C07275|nr:hypothetical protein [Lysobacter silvisoli]